VTEASAVERLIARLALAPHPEGGWFRETHHSDVVVRRDALPEGYPGDRCAVTAILFLLGSGERSAWHRVRSEEIWIHQRGDALRLRRHPPEDPAAVEEVLLGAGEEDSPQAVVPPGWWQTAEPERGPHGYVLVTCVVAPGFDFDDFELRA
jgi:predicted cupin superfamily sugar epimerase